MNLYGICIIASIILGITFISINLALNKVPKELIVLQTMLNITCTIYFSRLYTVITVHKHEINILNAGLSSLGAAIGLAISTLIFTAIYNESKEKVKSIVVTALPLMYGISKLGCHFSGCCYGIQYNGPFSIESKIDNTIQLFPIQLVESVVYIVLFLISILLFYTKRIKDYITIELVIYTVVKFLLDYLRYREKQWSLSINQITCLVVLVILLIRHLALKKYNRDSERGVT